MDKIKVGVVVGSARRQSFSKKVAGALVGMMPPELDMQMLDIAQLPIYNQDLDDDGTPPFVWTDFRAQVKGMDAYLFVTPEYNRCLPPLMKNALDIGSRPYGQNVWGGKPGAVVSVSPGSQGGFGANHNLRQAVVFLDIFLMQQPEAYIGGIAKCLDKEGNLTNESTLGFLQKVADGFADWVKRFY